MGRTVKAFNAITSHTLTEEQGWLFMGLLKMVRSQSGDFKADNFEDEAAYAALRGECAAGAVRQPSTAFAERIKAQEAAAGDGWIEWKGSNQPIDSGIVVDVMYNGGDKETAQAGSFDWDYDDSEFRVIAYRIHKAGV